MLTAANAIALKKLATEKLILAGIDPLRIYTENASIPADKMSTVTSVSEEPAPWAAMHLLSGRGEQIEIGSPGGNNYRYPGELLIAVHVPIGRGDAKIRKICEEVATALRSQIVSPTVTIKTASVIPVGNVPGGWYRVDVTCPIDENNVG